MDFNMKIITTIIKRFIKDDKKVLGRWNIDYCDKKMNNKIDLSLLKFVHELIRSFEILLR